MGASNNKPLRSVPSHRRRRFNPRNLLRQRTESEVNDFSNNHHGVYEDPRIGNYTQNDDFNLAPSWGDQDQVYYNEQNYDCRSNNGQTNNFGYQEETPQYAVIDYNQEEAFSSYSSVRNEANYDQSYLNYVNDGYNFSPAEFNGQCNSRPEAHNYEYGQSANPLIRHHSLNNVRVRPRPNHFYEYSNAFRIQSHSLNDINYETCYGGQSYSYGLKSYGSDSNVFQNHKSYLHNWNGSETDDFRMRKCNSASGVNTVGEVTRGGKKRNSLDEDFYGENFCSSASQDLSGPYQDLRNDNNLDANNIGPRVKRRPTCESQEGNYERSNSALSFYNDTPNNDKIDFTRENLDLESNQSDEQTSVLNILEYPAVWSSFPTNSVGFVDVPSSCMEGEKLRRFFHKTSRTREFQLSIIRIARIENPFLHTMYLLKKEELKLRNKHVDELHLFHGTKRENVPKICDDNFNWRLINEKHLFGKGISFSPLASYSSHYCDKSDVKVMLLLKVLVSNAITGSPEMEIPPITNGVTYDTSIKEDTSVIVKYCDNEFYPLYKITFKKRFIV